MRKLAALFAVGLMIIAFAAPPAALGFIHEKIGAECRAGGEEVIPPGQVRGGQSLVRALQATGIIESIDMSVPGQVTVNFDLSKPSAKYMSAGFDLTIPDGFGPGIDLILSPLPVPDPSFPAYANCRNLNPQPNLIPRALPGGRRPPHASGWTAWKSTSQQGFSVMAVPGRQIRSLNPRS